MKVRGTFLSAMIILSLSFVTICLPAGETWAAPGDEASDPIFITTAAQLDAIREGLNKFYKLSNDIDLTAYLAAGGAGYTKWGASGWAPIGDYNSTFKGGLDGAGHKITGLWVNRSATEYVGLFGYMEYALIGNLGVEITNTGVKGDKMVGGLGGLLYDGRIENCYTTGDISGNNLIGGLVGELINCSVINCYTTGNISGRLEIGGLVGRNYTSVSGCSIENCYATGNIDGDANIGGLVGFEVAVDNGSTAITSSRASGDVKGEGQVGGLVGVQECYDDSVITITNCYADGNVSADGISGGGLVGALVTYSSGDCIIAGSYAKGSVNGNNYIGGLVGQLTSNSNSSVTIRDSHSTGAVNGNYGTGGLMGLQYSFESALIMITNCNAKGAVSGGTNTGGLVGLQGSNNGGSNAILNCYSESDVTSMSINVGGLVGLQESVNSSNSRIENSYARGAVSGNDQSGGLVGLQYSDNGASSITGSYALGNVNGNIQTGGLVGYQFSVNNGDNSIANCYAVGNTVGAGGQTGGLVGLQSSTGGGANAIARSFANGGVTSGGFNAGGLVGLQYSIDNGSVSRIENSYSTGNVSGLNYVGAFAGQQCSSGNGSTSITYSYATGNANGDYGVSSFVGLQFFDDVGGNNSITGGYATGNIVCPGAQLGAIVGLQVVSADNTNTIANSFRYANLTVNGSVIPTTDPDNAPNRKNGGALTADNFMTRATYTGNTWLFNDSTPAAGPWYWDSRGFPKLNIGIEDFPFPWTQLIPTPIITINAQPQASTTVTAGSVTGGLSVTASVTGSGTLNYQWYSNTTNSNTGGAQIAGATGANFNIPAGLAAGTYYYYCVVSATDATPVTSNVARVTVEEARGCNAAGYGYLVFMLFAIPILFKIKK